MPLGRFDLTGVQLWENSRGSQRSTRQPPLDRAEGYFVSCLSIHNTNGTFLHVWFKANLSITNVHEINHLLCFNLLAFPLLFRSLSKGCWNKFYKNDNLFQLFQTLHVLIAPCASSLQEIYKYKFLWALTSCSRRKVPTPGSSRGRWHEQLTAARTTNRAEPAPRVPRAISWELAAPLLRQHPTAVHCSLLCPRTDFGQLEVTGIPPVSWEEEL